MLRIAVIGGSTDEVRNAALRVHGALIEPADDSHEARISASALAFIEPNPVDGEQIAAALDASRNVLVLTRAGLPLEQLDRLEASANRNGVVLSIINPERSLPSRRLIRKQIDDGKLGDVGLVRVCRGEHSSADSGSLLARLVSDLDLALWLVGHAPSTVYAIQQSGSQPGERFRQIHLGFDTGAMALLSHSTIWPSSDPHQSLSVIAFSGAAYADDHQNRQLLYGNASVTAPAADEGTGLVEALHDFVAEIQKSAAATDRNRSWHQLLPVIAAVERSLASHDAVSLECR